MTITGKAALFSIIFLCNGFSSFAQLHKADIYPKWYIRTDRHNPDKFTVTIDAKNVNRYIQLSNLRFVIGFKDMNGKLLNRDTINFFQKSDKSSADFRNLYLAGNNAITRTFTRRHGLNEQLTGILLLYNWYDTSMSTDPDPFGEKVIFEDTIQGEGTADVSDNQGNLK
jgi:hypothetical protein